MRLFQNQIRNSGRLWVRRRPVTEIKGLLQSSEGTDLQAVSQFLWDLPSELEKTTFSNPAYRREFSGPSSHTRHCNGEWHIGDEVQLSQQHCDSVCGIKAIECWYYIDFCSTSLFPWPSSISFQRAGVNLSLWPFCFGREEKKEWTTFLSSPSWKCSPLYPGAHQSRPAWHKFSGLKKGREGVPWQVVPPLSQATRATSRCLFQQKWSPPARIPTPGLPECCKTPHRTECCAPPGSTHPDAKSMALWYFEVLTLASPFISWHKVEEFAVLPVNRAVTSQGRQFKFNYNNGSCYISLFCYNIVSYYIMSKAHNASQKVPHYT